MKINIKELIEQPSTIQEIEEKKIKEYEVINEEEFIKLYKKHFDKEVKLKLSKWYFSWSLKPTNMSVFIRLFNLLNDYIISYYLFNPLYFR